MNGAAGTLSGCFVASQLIAARKFSRALILASEVEHNAATSGRRTWLGVKEAASALVLEESSGNEGFIAFGSRCFPSMARQSSATPRAHENRPALFHRHDPALDRVVARRAYGPPWLEFLEPKSSAAIR